MSFFRRSLFQIPICSELRSNLLQSKLLTSDKLDTRSFIRTKKTAFDAPQTDLARRPIRVYEPGEEVPKPGQKQRTKYKPTIDEEIKKIGSTSKPSETTPVDLFGKLMGSIVGNVHRKRIALEGTRLIQEALQAKLHPEKFFLLKSIKDIPCEIKAIADDGSVELIRITQKQMETWSSVTTPPGIIGIFRKPTIDDIARRIDSEISQRLPLTVICDNVREPGNLGSILRSAAGAGCREVMLTKGCTDPWDLKVLRGGCGAHFQIPIQTDLHMSTIGSYIEFEETPVNDEDQKRRKSSKSTGVFLADSNTTSDSSRLQVFSFTDVDYSQFEEIYLVVGGETEGLSRSTLQITNSLVEEEKLESKERRRTVARLHIPLQSHVESLNVSNAFGIIAFEIRRQFQKTNSSKTL